MNRRRAAVVAVAACTAVAIVATPAVAWARYTSTDSAALTLTAATLAAPANVTATAKCNNGLSSSIDVSWTATTSAFATGYTVALTPAVGTPTTTPVAGRTTTSASVPVQRSGAVYTVTVVATYRTWTSAAAAASGPVLC